MKWERAGKYAIRCGDWIIAKYFVDGKAVYGVTFKNERRGFFDDLDRAKKLAGANVEKEAA
jgi:hypothetical protein